MDTQQCTCNLSGEEIEFVREEINTHKEAPQSEKELEWYQKDLPVTWTIIIIVIVIAVSWGK